MPLVRMRHRDLEKGRDPFRKLARKQLQRDRKRLSIRGLNTACYPRIKIRHKDLAQVCYPRFKVKHKDLQAKCLPRFKVKHKDLQSKCYPTPKVKHKNLSAACLPRYKVKHKDLNNVCYKPAVKVRHKSLNNVCYRPIVIRHKNMDKLSCTELQIRHTDLNKVKIACDPNMRDHTTTMERIGKEVKYWFTRHKKFCKLEARYSGVSQGNIVETSLGTAVVEDYVVRKNTYYPIKIVVSIPRDKGRDKKGEPRLSYHKLTREETKEIMIRELIKRQKFIWLVRMYPEERPNLDALKTLYQGGGTDPNAPGAPPPDNVPGSDDN